MEVSLYGMDWYTISDDGKIYSLDYNHTGKKKELVGYTDKDGYRVILIKNKIYPNGIKIKRYRAVADHFIPNPDNLPQVNHKDTVRQHDSADNLEWCTNTYNQQYASRCGSFDCIKKTVIQMDVKGNIINTYKSICEASRMTGVCRIGITNCLGGKQRMSGGFVWKKGGEVNHGQ